MAGLLIPVTVKYSENAGAVPEPSTLSVGEIWVNVADGRFGTKQSDDQVLGYSLFTSDEKTQALAQPTWGSIGGTLTLQEDLVKALSKKASIDQDNTFAGQVSATTFIGPLEGNANTSSKLQTSRTINGYSFDGSANVNQYAVCETGADVSSKEITVDNFNLVIGATVIITFAFGISSSSNTLNINSTGAKQLIQNGLPLGSLSAGVTMMFVYDGTVYRSIGVGEQQAVIADYYTKSEADALFLTKVNPVVTGDITVAEVDTATATEMVSAYNQARASSSISATNVYTKAEADALFATKVNPVITGKLDVSK